MENENLTELLIPKDLFGSVETFQNYDPIRIKHYETSELGIHIYISELDRMDSIREFQTTLEAFQYEVERAQREETVSFKSFEYDFDYTKLIFVVEKELFEEDVSAQMIEHSIVYDALMYQVYSKKIPTVSVKYVNANNRKVFLTKDYPGNQFLF